MGENGSKATNGMFFTEWFVAKQGFWNKAKYLATNNLLIAADLVAAGVDKAASLAGKEPNLRVKFDDYMERSGWGLAGGLLSSVATTAAAAITTISLPSSISHSRQVALGNEQPDSGIVDSAVLKITGAEYKTDMVAASKFCTDYIQEKIALCKKLGAEQKIDRLGEIAQTLSLLKVDTIAKHIDGLNPEKYEPIIKRSVDEVILREVKRLGLDGTTVLDELLKVEPSSAKAVETSATTDAKQRNWVATTGERADFARGA